MQSVCKKVPMQSGIYVKSSYKQVQGQTGTYVIRYISEKSPCE